MDDARRSGFTLVELLVTLALAALLGSLAVPAMTRLLDNARLRSAAEALVQELHLARNHALTRQQTVVFSLSAGAGPWCYGWREGRACNCRAQLADSDACRTGSRGSLRLHRRSSADYPAIDLDSGFPSPAGTLRFSPIRGTASAGSLTLRNARGEVRVIVSPLGRVRRCSSGNSLYPPC
jgi:type IV fimbrial biogenesis protein FimT